MPVGRFKSSPVLTKIRLYMSTQTHSNTTLLLGQSQIVTPFLFRMLIAAPLLTR